jgi:hypothetical protein
MEAEPLEETVRKESSAEADGEGAERSSSARRREEKRGRAEEEEEEEEAMGVGGLRKGRSRSLPRRRDLFAEGDDDDGGGCARGISLKPYTEG